MTTYLILTICVLLYIAIDYKGIESDLKDIIKMVKGNSKERA